MRHVCYTTFQDKQSTFGRVTVPLIFKAAQEGAQEPALADWLHWGGVLDAAVGLPQLRALHELARAGRYVPGPRGCDAVIDVPSVIDGGGDCDNWAAVIIAALYYLGYPARLSAFGDAQDLHEHVVAAAWYGNAWRYLDAKGDQEGGAFLERPQGFRRETIYLVR